MKRFSFLLFFMAGIWAITSSCHHGYVCDCSLKDSIAIVKMYSLDANSASEATAKCNTVQAQNPGDTCRQRVLKD